MGCAGGSHQRYVSESGEIYRCITKPIEVHHQSHLGRRSFKFKSELEEVCERESNKLSVILSRSPKLNANVERAQRTDTEDLYEATENDFEISGLNISLMKWETVYEAIHPH